ncbi:hypothetical protein BDV96DRAFT_583253 [Lophiotrema nucula]|uniref:F-box domain-containing protein n=1 Tax=Lophiotrema nucula TaxID=690887 RepID=A0A6A5YV43_9PLEO|nr:hypothetical protein BDV96DRAFT_583253 [Lophiotrema nucula]
MPSHRLEHYFTPVSRPSIRNQRLTFLELPHAIQRRIYDYACLKDDLIDLNWTNFQATIGIDADYTDAIRFPCYHHDIPILREGTTGEENWAVNLPDNELLFLKDSSCTECKRDNAYSLLFVSKQVSKEAMNVLYGHHTFRIDQSMPNGLKRLKALGPDPLSALSRLIIRLDIPRSRVDACENFEAYPEPLNAQLASHKRLIREWAGLVDNLTNAVRPDQLQLYLCFRALTLETIESVLLHLERLPKLRAYGIWTDIPFANRRLRLEQDKVSRVRAPLDCLRSKDRPAAFQVSSLVNRTAKRHQTCSSIGPVFRYLDLPQEIRFQILEYTDLVTSEGVQWRSTTRPRSSMVPWSCQCSIDILEEVGGCLCHSNNTQYYDHSELISSYNPDDQPCCGKCGPSEERLLCFCSTSDAPWSSSCNCQRHPHPLFFVSIQVRQDAIPVYYRYNQFVITPYGCPSMHPDKRRGYEPPVAQSLDPRSELSLYLSGLTRGAIGHIRWLEWAMPEHDKTYMNSQSAMWRDYLDTVQMMEHAMNIPELTLVINMSAFAMHQRWPDMYHHSSPLSLSMDVKVWRRYADKMKPLVRLHHLKDFFVYLRRDIDKTFRINLEKEFEQLIKGPNYDSAQRGKPEERFRWYETYCLATY